MIPPSHPTKAEWMFLRDVKALDDIQQGMLRASRETEAALNVDPGAPLRLEQRGWVRLLGARGTTSCVYCLSTKGLRALQRHHQRLNP
jgi:hypothetical protein